MRRLKRSANYTRAIQHVDYSLDVEDGVLRVHSSLVLGGLTDETLLAGERDERGSGEATLLVGNCKQEWLDGYPDHDGISGRILISTLVPS